MRLIRNDYWQADLRLSGRAGNVEENGPEPLTSGVKTLSPPRRADIIERYKRRESSVVHFLQWGMLSLNLPKDGEVINFHYDFHLEKRFIEENWLAEKHKKP
ncbi:MAG: hypothetical protein ACYSW0_15520 [Planctomycetota bacterium]